MLSLEGSLRFEGKSGLTISKEDGDGTLDKGNGSSQICGSQKVQNSFSSLDGG